MRRSSGTIEDAVSERVERKASRQRRDGTPVTQGAFELLMHLLLEDRADEALKLVIARLRAGLEVPRRWLNWGGLPVGPAQDDSLPQEVEIRPEWLRWNGGTVRKLAWSIRWTRSYADLPVLAAALREAGCKDAWVMHHLLELNVHRRDCWLLRKLSGEE